VTVTDLSEYKDRMAGRDWLGRIVFVTIRQANISAASVEASMKGAALDTFVPKARCDADVFRKVTTEAKESRIALPGGGRVNVLVPDVAADEEEILRRIVIEGVDSKGKRLSYTEAYDLRFDKATGAVQVRKLPAIYGDPGEAVADRVAQAIPAAFAARKGTVDADQMRAAVQRILDSVKATAVRPTGGAYFIRETHAAVADRLEELAANVANVEIHSLPLVDDAKQRGMVAAAVADEINRAIESHMAEIAKMLQDGNVSSKKLATKMTEHAELVAKAREYTEVTSADLSAVTVRLDLLNQQMQTALNHAA